MEPISRYQKYKESSQKYQKEKTTLIRVDRSIGERISKLATELGSTNKILANAMLDAILCDLESSPDQLWTWYRNIPKI